MSEKLISIIVPVYKVEKELACCVNSLLEQTYQNIEIILVDDGSPDKCPQLCDEYQKQHHNVKVIHKSNGGLSDARNVGLDMATGEYVLYVDSDDYLEKDACEKLVSAIKNTDADFVVGVIKEVRNDNISYQRHSNLESGKQYASSEFIIKSILANEWYAPAVLNLYRRNFLLDNQLYYKKGRIFEDVEMLPRLFLSAKKVIYLDYAFYNYIIREESITSSEISPAKIESAILNYTEWKILFDNVEDLWLRKHLYGILIRYYLRTCRVLNITGWKVPGLTANFALGNALNTKEKMKVLFFAIAPKLYVKNAK